MFFNRTQTRLTVAHVEDDPLWREMAQRASSETRDVEYVGYARNSREGLSLCREKRPRVALVDLGLPDGDGFQLVNELETLPEPPRIVLLSCRTDEVTLFRAWNDNIAGLIWKTPRCADHLKEAFPAVSAGRRYFPKDVLEAVSRFRSSPTAFFKILTTREQSLIEAFVRGDSDEDIAQALALSRHTIHSHRTNIMAKLNLHSTRELIRWGLERGFYRSPAMR